MNIKETLQPISDCDLYIGNDTGWAHISVALNVKAITIFCDSPVVAYGSYSSNMYPIIPDGESTISHNTFGKDKIKKAGNLNQSRSYVITTVKKAHPYLND